MKPRELILLSLLLLGGTAVVAVGWRLIATPQTAVPVAAKPAPSPTPSAEFKPKKQTAAKVDSEEQKTSEAAAKATADPGASFANGVQLALTDPDRGNRFRAILELVKKLDLSKISDALHFADSLEGREKDFISRMVVGRWGSLDPISALGYAQQLPDKEQAAGAKMSALFGWTTASPAAALAWIGTQPAGEERSQLLGNSIGIWARDDPQAAANYLATLQNPADQAAAASRIASTWGWSDPSKALAWANTLSDQTLKNDAYRGVISSMSRQDPASAAGVIQTLSPGSLRDQAVSAYSQTVGRRDPQGALQMAQTITDPATRTANIEQVATTWMSRNPDEAKAWITPSDQLTAEAKTRILNTPKDMNAGRGFGGGFGGPPQ